MSEQEHVDDSSWRHAYFELEREYEQAKAELAVERGEREMLHKWRDEIKSVLQENGMVNVDTLDDYTEAARRLVSFRLRYWNEADYMLGLLDRAAYSMRESSPIYSEELIEEIEEYLLSSRPAPPKQDTGEPVAWQIVDRHGTSWGLNVSDDVAELIADSLGGGKVIPLYRHPADAIPREEVEALVAAATKAEKLLRRDAGWAEAIVADQLRAALREHTGGDDG